MSLPVSCVVGWKPLDIFSSADAWKEAGKWAGESDVRSEDIDKSAKEILVGSADAGRWARSGKLSYTGFEKSVGLSDPSGLYSWVNVSCWPWKKSKTVK